MYYCLIDKCECYHGVAIIINYTGDKGVTIKGLNHITEWSVKLDYISQETL